MWVYTLLPKILNMSLTASIVIVLVLIARILLKKAPKVFSYALWAVVLFRLVCPVSFPSEFSLLGLFNAPAATNGSVAYIPDDIVHTEYPQVDLPLPGVSEVVNNSLPQGEEQIVADPLEFPMAAATTLWLLGIVAMLIYSTVSLMHLRRKLIGAVYLRDNIYLVDHIATPFVIGVFRPKTYLPSILTEQEQSYIILHEQTHIRRLDHIFKMVAFLALAVHWFNPLVWVAFVCAVKDMEMSCDERVLKEMGGEIKGAYSTSLLTLAMGRRLINGSALAFGEGNIKGRIKNVMNFKKPTFWTLIAAAAAVIVATVCLLTNPAKTSPDVSAFNTIYTLSPAYAFDKSLYMNPLSSYIPFGGTGQLYLFDPDKGFTIIDEETGEVQESVSPINWNGKEVDTEEWKMLFSIGKPVDISSYSVRMQYDISDKYRVYQMGSEVWLASINSKINGMWSLYRLKETTIPDFERNTVDTALVPTSPKLSPGQTIGVGMPELDYADDNIVIFHGYFGLFVYDLETQKIIRSLDLEPIGCQQTQGSDACEVTVSVDGGKVFMRTMETKKMYVWDLTAEPKVSLYKASYDSDWPEPDERFRTVDIETALDNSNGNYSYRAADLGNGFFGWIHTSDWTLRTLTYTREGDMMYRLFDFDSSVEEWELITRADVDRDNREDSIYLDKSQIEDRFVTLRIIDVLGIELWSEQFGTPHAGWGQLFLCELDSKQYLLRYTPGMFQGYCTYIYTLFTLEGGKEKGFRTNTLEFDINGTKELDVSKMNAFADEVNALLGKSILLVSTDGGDFHYGPSSTEPFFERFSWLDEYPELFENGDDLEAQLNKFNEYAVSNRKN